MGMIDKSKRHVHRWDKVERRCADCGMERGAPLLFWQGPREEIE